MSVLRTLLFLLVGGFIILFIIMRQNERAYDKSFGAIQPTSPNAFAVVELFTSQNCRECIDADKMISQILADTDPVGLPIYVLTFHTDHMDSYHWQDPYGQSLFSDRFRGYVMAQKKQYDALPQIVFNGYNTLTTPNRMKTYHILEDFLSSYTPMRIDLWGEMSGKRFLTLRYTGINFNASAPLVLHTALVEKGLQKKVTAGPNDGMTLIHDNVVRELISVNLPDSAEGSVDLFIKDHYFRPNLSVIAYVQDSRSLRILAANELLLSDVPEEIVMEPSTSPREMQNSSQPIHPEIEAFFNDPAIPQALR